jgi:hypothetical protein
MEGNVQIQTVTFSDFLFKNKRNRFIIIISGIIIVLLFAAFKYFYPYASYIHGDSFAYLGAANDNVTINHYLVGYSKFLRLFNTFSSSDLALTGFQYLFIQSAILFLLFTLFFFYRISRVVQVLLLSFMVFNPLSLHLANLVSSDGFFLALSLLWFTLLLWIAHRPSVKIIILQAIILLLSFTVRYNALIYPLISIIAFCLAPLTWRQKLIGGSLGHILCGLFIFYTSYQYKQLTGYWQYSPFSGWQLANNAMYAYRYVDSTERKPVPEKFRMLDRMIREFFDSTRDVKRFPSEAAVASTFYMWSSAAPLMTYSKKILKNDTAATEFKKWANAGPHFKQYGIFIIKQYPWHFIRYFVWPNAARYYAPPIEFLENYNSGVNWVTLQAKVWFGYKSPEVKTRMKNKRVWLLDFYPIMAGVINVVMLCCLLSFGILRGWKSSPWFTKGVIIGGAVWLMNAAFTIGASAAALRFQSFPIIIAITFVVIKIDWMLRLMAIEKSKELSIKVKNESQATIFSASNIDELYQHN